MQLLPARRAACLTICVGAVFIATSASAQREALTDFFDRAPLHPAWTFRAPHGGQYQCRDGWVHIAAPGDRFMNPHEDFIAPMLLIEPPADEAFSFETRLDWVVYETGAYAGLIAIRKDMSTRMLLQYRPRPWGMAQLEWWDGLEGEGCCVAAVLSDREDIWLRAEMIGRGAAFFPKFSYKQGGADDPWTRATNPGGRAWFLPNGITPRFDPGEYWIGLFVEGGLGPDSETQVAFDYFHSPELRPLSVDPAGASALVWASLKAP